jgi:hypothetical protein
MQDKQWIILEKIQDLIQEISDFKFVAFYPDDVQFLGNKFPAVLISDGQENFEIRTGGLFESEYIVSLYLYHNVNINRIETILSLQNKIIGKLQDSLTNESTAVLIEVESVEKGDYSSVVDKFNVGWYPNLTVRKINFKLMVCYSR